MRPAAFALLVLATALLPLARFAIGQIGSTSVRATDLLTALAYLAAVPFLRRLPWRLLLVALSYLAVLALSLIVNPDVAGAPKLIGYAPFVLLPVLAATFVQPPTWLFRAWLFGATLAIGWAFLDLTRFYLAGGGQVICTYGALPPLRWVPRLCGSFANPNMFCDFLIASLPLAFVEARRRWPWAAWALLVAGLVVGLFSLSTAFGGLLLAVAFVLPLAGRWRTGALTVAAAAALFLAVATVSYVVPAGQGHVSVAGRDVVVGQGPRPAVWGPVLELIARRPLLGAGYGQNVSVPRDPRAFGPAIDQVPAGARMDAHNAFLNVAGQAGLLGLAAFAAYLAALLRPLVRHRSVDPRRRALQGALLGLAFHALFMASEETRHLWYLLATLSLTVRVANPDGSRPGPSQEAP